jgi:PmbA protein
MGEFSVNLDLGFKVEHGKLKGRLKNIMVTGNSYDLLKDTRAIGDKQYQSGATYTPHLYFDALSVAG